MKLALTTKICRRKSDGKLFRASYPDHWNDGHAIASMLSGGSWYFRGVEFWGRFFLRDTGEIWEFNEYGLFDVITTKEARKNQCLQKSTN